MAGSAGGRRHSTGKLQNVISGENAVIRIQVRPGRRGSCEPFLHSHHIAPEPRGRQRNLLNVKWDAAD